MFDTTFNYISVISWWSVLLMEETKIHKKCTQKNHWPAANYWQTLSHSVSSTDDLVPGHDLIHINLIKYNQREINQILSTKLENGKFN